MTNCINRIAVILSLGAFAMGTDGSCGDSANKTFNVTSDEAQTLWLSNGELMAHCIQVEAVRKNGVEFFRPKTGDDVHPTHRFFTKLAVTVASDTQVGATHGKQKINEVGDKFIFSAESMDDKDAIFTEQCTVLRVN
jgi:hypothetical protein